jgi:RimJ/RimL family protein N-acetyltransferase
MSPFGPLPDMFTTSRLRAERLRPAHAAEVHRMHLDAAVMAHLGGVRDEAFDRAYLERNLRHWDEFGFGPWVVSEIGGSEPIGRGLLRHLPVDGIDEVEVGYAFYPTYWGKGYATEIAAACVDLAYRVLDAPAVVAITSPTNVASQHVLEKCGLVYERPYEKDGATWALYRGRK